MNVFSRIPLQFSFPSIRVSTAFLSSARALEQKTLRVAIPIFQSISEIAFRTAKKLMTIVLISDLIALASLLCLSFSIAIESPVEWVEFVEYDLCAPALVVFIASLVATCVSFAFSCVSFGVECVLYKYALERIAGLQEGELDLSLLHTLLNWKSGSIVRELIFQERSLQVFGEIQRSFQNLPPRLQLDLNAFLDGNDNQVDTSIHSLHVRASSLRLDYTPVAASAYNLAGEAPVMASFVTETFCENTRRRACTYSSFPRRIEGVVIDGTTFASLFRRMEEKHRGLHDGTSEVAVQIRDAFSQDYTPLKYNLCHGEISQMLRRGGDEQRVAPEYLQLHSIFRYIFSLSDQVESTTQGGFFSFLQPFLPSNQQRNQLLSPREEVLLALASSVQGCVSGKKTSIAAFYNRLPFEFKRQEVVQSSERAEDIRVEEFVYQTLMREVASQFDSSSSFVRDRLGIQDRLGINYYPPQLAHETIFLKNFIGARVGLPDGIQQDPHEGVVSHALYGGNRATAFANPEPLVRATLDSFYRSFTPNLAIGAIKRELADRGALLAPINNLIEGEEYLGRVEVDENGHFVNLSTNQIVWEVDSSDVLNPTAKITDYGAFLLLKALGYLA